MPFGGLLTAGISTVGGLLGGHSSSKPTYTKDQSALQSQLFQALSARLNNPANLDPLQTTATGQINQNYNGLQDRLNEDFAQSGFGRSGTLATNKQRLELSRQGDLGDLASRFAGYKIDQENKTIDQANQFSFAHPGESDSSGGGLGGALGGFAGGGGIGAIGKLFGSSGGGSEAIGSGGIDLGGGAVSYG